MESRAFIIGACWIAVALISIAYIWVGGVNTSTDIAVGLLVLLAFMITFGVGFGERFGTERDRELQAQPVLKVLDEIADMSSRMDEISRKVDEIKKALEE